MLSTVVVMTDERDPPAFDPKGRIVVYRAVADVIEGRIKSGTYPADSRLPSEPALVAEFGCARDTVRAAIKELRARGLVETVSGKGSFILPERRLWR